MSAVAQQVSTQDNRSHVRLWLDMLVLFKELWKVCPLALLAALAINIGGNARTGLYVTAMGGVVDALTKGSAGGHSALFWVGMYIFASALEEFYWAIYPVMQTYLGDHGSYRIQRQVMERAAAAPLIQFEEGEFFDHLQRASENTGDRLVVLLNQIMGLGQPLIMGMSLATALYFVHPILLPLLILGTLPSIWLQTRIATAMYRAERRHTTRDRVRTHLERLLTMREAASEVRLFGLASYLIGRWRYLRDERKRDILGAERKRALFATTGDVIAGAAYAGALVFVAYMILQGQLSVGNYVTVLTGALWFSGALDGIIGSVRSLEEQSQFLGDLFDFLRAARIEGTASNGENIPRQAGMPAPPAATATTGSPVARTFLSAHPESNSDVAALRGMTVEAESLTFGYPGSQRPVLRDVSLSIRRGESVALVGENGAGKTTLVRLLTGLYQPDRGAVRLDGEPLVPERVLDVRQRIAAVFQDYATYQLTARENIGFGNPECMGGDQALTVAARKADIGALIARLPEGLDSYLGREFGETDVSGGQWQRIALARAFFRDADLLVLDEPTAALDPKAELALFERFAELVQDRTAIMISHRLGMARLADRIIVLENGEVAEVGAHEHLISSGGVYARMFAAQARWYQ